MPLNSKKAKKVSKCVQVTLSTRLLNSTTNELSAFLRCLRIHLQRILFCMNMQVKVSKSIAVTVPQENEGNPYID
jgi:hypothetical protein